MANHEVMIGNPASGSFCQPYESLAVFAPRAAKNRVPGSRSCCQAAMGNMCPHIPGEDMPDLDKDDQQLPLPTLCLAVCFSNSCTTEINAHLSSLKSKANWLGHAIGKANWLGGHAIGMPNSTATTTRIHVHGSGWLNHCKVRIRDA